MIDQFTSSPVFAGYILLMFASAVSFLTLSRIWRPVPFRFFIVHFFVVLWSGLMYLTQVLGITLIDANTSIATFFYQDWIVSTPLMMLALGLSAIHFADRSVWGRVFGIIGLQALVILTGAIADVSTETLFWFGVSVSLYLPLFWIVWTLRDEMGSRTFTILAGFITVMWVTYPTIWLLGPAQFEIIGIGLTEDLFSVVPAFSKAGFGFLDLWLLKETYTRRIRV